MSMSIAKAAQSARIVATGQVTSKAAIYDLIAAVRKLDGKLPPGWPMLLHLEDFVSVQQFGGEFELAAELARVKKRRKLFAHVQDAAVGTAAITALLYCNQRSANVPALVGGFGDVHVLVESSTQAAKEGISVRVIKAGEFKGAGTPGTAISPEQLAVLSKPTLEATELMLNELIQFLHWTTDQSAEIRSGKVFIGNDLKRLKFVQRFTTVDEAFSNFLAAVERANNVPKV